MNTENTKAEELNTPKVADLDLDVLSLSAPAKPKVKRNYNRRSTSEKLEVLNDIVDKFNRVVITRVELLTMVDKDLGRPWQSFAFVFNAKECYVKRGVYDLTKIKGLPFSPKLKESVVELNEEL